MSDVRILQGDCRAVLKTLESNSVQMVCTSPPYFRLRDYGVVGQIGLEDSVEGYVAELASVFDEVHRVLRPDGTVWLNLGDRYSSEPGNMNANLMRWSEEHGGGKNGGRRKEFPDIPASPVPAKRKDLLMLPARVAIALQARGWWLRAEVIWAKTAPQPESQKDRPTRSHESLFLLAKSETYFYDHVAIREPDSGMASGNGFAGRSDHRLSGGLAVGGTEERWLPGGGRNKRDVWLLGPEPYPDAHFAVMPTKLAEPCILAGSSEKGCCPDCGTPWRRVLRKADSAAAESEYEGKWSVQDRQAASRRMLANTARLRQAGGHHDNPFPAPETLRWEAGCNCGARAPIPCTVLDPFAGSGTVGRVALKHHRDAVLIELNPDYCQLIEKRINGVQVVLPLDVESA